MMRWSPTRSVFSIEPEGMTRAWPMVPLINRNASPTQNQAMTSRWTRCAIGSLGSSTFLAGGFPVSLTPPLLTGSCVTSAFTFHHHGFLDCCVVARITVRLLRAAAIAPVADFKLDEVRGIDSGITRRTELAFGVIHSLAEGGKRNVAERIRAEKLANIFGGIGRGNELFAGGRVDAVVARRNCGWTADAHVDFTRARFADHANDFAASGAADDGVVDKNDALAFDQTTDGIELQLYAKTANGLRRLDERAADVVIANQAHTKRDF